eukprot:4766109-Alexandrium_andersonii.AAC.1
MGSRRTPCHAGPLGRPCLRARSPSAATGEAVAEERDEPLRRKGEPRPRGLPRGSPPLARGLGSERR